MPAADPVGRAAEVRAEIDFALAHEEVGGTLQRLLEAGKRMMRLIETMKNASNKDISRLTDQLNALFDKYK